MISSQSQRFACKCSKSSCSGARSTPRRPLQCHAASHGGLGRTANHRSISGRPRSPVYGSGPRRNLDAREKPYIEAAYVLLSAPARSLFALLMLCRCDFGERQAASIPAGENCGVIDTPMVECIFCGPEAQALIRLRTDYRLDCLPCCGR